MPPRREQAARDGHACARGSRRAPPGQPLGFFGVMARVEPRRTGAPARRVTVVPAWGTARARHARRRVVLEQGNGVVAGVEVKAAATVVTAEFRGVRKLREAASPH